MNLQFPASYKTITTILTLLLFSYCAANAQQNLPVIRSNSRDISVRDGLHLKKGTWSLMPERKPDIYFSEIPEKAHRISFITDIDSISFDMRYGKIREFIVLLNGKDSCYTRVSSTYKEIQKYTQTTPIIGPDTIPFTLGDSRKVYVEALLNGSKVKNIQLDLGAGGTVINEVAIKKVKINFDGKVNLANSDGINEVRSASKNTLQIGNLVWDSVPVVVARNMKPHEDLIIGNYLFKGKILEINYDKKILVISDSLPAAIRIYTKHDFILDGGVIPHIKVTLNANGQKQTGWAMFDTGARTSIVGNHHVPLLYRIGCELAAMIGLGDKVSPRLSIDQYELSGFEYKTRNMNGPGLNMILGNDLLKRFNLIFDNKTGHLYMKPNSLTSAPYGKPDLYYIVRVITGLMVTLAVVIVLLRIGKKRKKVNGPKLKKS